MARIATTTASTDQIKPFPRMCVLLPVALDYHYTSQAHTIPRDILWGYGGVQHIAIREDR